MFEKLKYMWLKKYISKETLQKWVEINNINKKQGISQEQFLEIISQ